MKKKLPIGVSDFKKLIEGNLYFVDKSLFIKEIIEDGGEIILLPRPRRFGKTLNMSMLKYFFEKTDEDNTKLFKNLSIYKYKKYMEHHNKYPVIYITFKDLKDSSWENCYNKLKEIIIKEFLRHKYVLSGELLDDIEKNSYIKIMKGEANEAQYETSFKNLTEYISKYHNQKPIILIDEYDVPLQSGYVEGYYDKAVGFIRSFLCGVLKDNTYLHKGILTGILKVAKESIFSGLNNLNTCTILDYEYSNHFGFLEEEVFEMMDYYGVETNKEEIKKWYNGYLFGGITVYNPWSVISFANKWRSGLKPHWLNTSSNDLIKEILTKGDIEIKKDMEKLLNEQTIEKQIDENICMEDVKTNTSTIWSLLLFSGYLKVVGSYNVDEETIIHKLCIPNIEVRSLYKKIITAWFSNSIDNTSYTYMLNALTTGDMATFGKIFKQYVLSSISYFDVGGKAPEKVYHAFVLGILVALNKEYEVVSNGESGYGRYDVMLIPRDISKLGIIFEFKKKRMSEDLEICAQNALKQIEDKKYRQRLIDKGIKDIIDIGIAFDGKKVLVKSARYKWDV